MGYPQNHSGDTDYRWQDQLEGYLVAREKPKRADYVLYLYANNPIAIIEAKDNDHSVSFGLQQAMAYTQMLDLPFAYSSNGDGFAEHDFLTGTEREFGMDEFLSEAELIARYKAERNGGAGITPAEEVVLDQPYYSSQNTYPPRYYQRIAVNRTLDAIARGRDRLLLVMATGTGKTYTAFQIVYRLLQSGMKRKVLHLVDRNFLADTSIQQGFAPLQEVIHKINYAKDDAKTISAYQVYISLYQQLVAGADKESDEEDDVLYKLKELFRPDFFDLIIVDECHRGSAKAENRWRAILEHFSSATQIGMTTTPKETKYISNISYYGDPIYTYSLKEGIDDGFLAPFKVINITTDISEGWRPTKGQRDKNGVLIEDRIYTNRDFDYNIVIEDRVQQVASGITKYLKATDRMAKTLAFCATEDAAENMRRALVNLNADMVKKNPDYPPKPKPGPDDPDDPPVPPGPPIPPTPPRVKPIVDENDCRVEIIYKTVSIYDTNGKLLRKESITDYTKENVRGEYATLDAFIREWRADPKKEKIRGMLRERGINLEMMKTEQGVSDVDDFDFICHVAYDKMPLTRKERANNVKKRDFLSKYSGVAREMLKALMDKYMNVGIYEIGKAEILKLDPFLKYGKPAKISSHFGEKAGYLKAVQELEDAIYMDEVV